MDEIEWLLIEECDRRQEELRFREELRRERAAWHERMEQGLRPARSQHEEQ